MYGACLLGSLNLARLVDHPFSDHAALDLVSLEEHVRVAVRFLDNIIDISRYPLPAQKSEADAKRRIGLGVTGLADALILCGLDYDSELARHRAGEWMAAVQNAAYVASAELAAERGAFALFDPGSFLASANVARLGEPARAAIAMHGIRNGCLTSIAPTGTISLLAGNVSSGIEPVFAIDYERRVLEPDGGHRTEMVSDYAAALFRSLNPDEPLPSQFVTVASLGVDAHLKMQSAMQPYVDSSISKTINCPSDMPFESFQNVYLKAYDLGLKGCTTFRPNEVTGAILTDPNDAVALPGRDENHNGSVVARRIPDAGEASEVVVNSEPLERSDALGGQTYKLKWPGSAHAIYVTINDIERDGRTRPFEIFINTKNLEHQAWTVALTRMISAVFRRGGDVSFVVEELKAIYDPQGGQWLRGRYVPSLIAAIGDVIERHLIDTGFLERGVRSERRPVAGLVFDEPDADGRRRRAQTEEPDWGRMQSGGGRQCPRCGLGQLVRLEGCWTCPECGYSQCG